MYSWSRPVATGELGSSGGGQGEGPSQESLSHPLLPRLSGKEEALCRLQEENRRLSREQERVSRADRRAGQMARQRDRARGRQGGRAGRPGPGAGCLPDSAALAAGRQAVADEQGWTQEGFRVLERLGTDPASHPAPSCWKSWSGSSRAGSSWKASGTRRKATGRPR